VCRYVACGDFLQQKFFPPVNKEFRVLHFILGKMFTSAKNRHAARASAPLIFKRSTRADGVTSFIYTVSTIG